MISKIADHISQKLIAISLIEENDRDLYVYGFFLLIARIFFFIIVIIAGFLTGILFESIVFYFVFVLLRTYAGGMHAKTEAQCTILTTFALTASVIYIRILSQMQSISCSIFLLISGCLCILLFSPLDTKAKPLDAHEKKNYRSACHIIVLLCAVGAVFTYILRLDTFFCAIVIGIFLEAILLLMGIVFS